jgi:DNA-binding response OmpR family regulator
MPGLAVEDQDAIRDLIVQSLEVAGYQVIEADTADQALRSVNEAQGNGIRALVTDIDLGDEITGWDIAHRARELDPSLPVIYVTGGQSDAWAVKGVPNSILITKPFAPAQIVTAVSQLLNTPSQ